MNLEDARHRVAQASWYHSFELMPGLRTPGETQIEPSLVFAEFGMPEDLSGKTALDIGAWDGPYTFELERRGASVTALDVQDPDATGFNAAREVLGSSADYVRGSVYHLGRLFEERRFDVVCFFGVFYHLKHPILAFEQIRQVMAPAGHLHLEGECLLGYAEELSGARYDSRPLADIDVPIALCYPGHYKNASNWFIPNLACLRSWLQACGFEMVGHKLYDEPGEPFPMQRVRATAEATAAMPVEEHPIYEPGWTH